MTGELGAIIWGASGGWTWAGVIAMAIACVAISIGIHAKQKRVLPRFWGIIMLILRSVALVVICLSLLEPTIVRPRHADEMGGIGILIDRSRSMSAIDSGTDEAQQGGAGPHGITRFEKAKDAVARLVKEIPESVPIYGGFFDSTLMPAVLRENGKAIWPNDINASGDGSDITGAVGQLFERMNAHPLRAVVLLTDGRQVGGRLGAISEDSGTPIFPILSADTPRDLVLEDVSGPRFAYLDEPVAVQASIRGTNLADLPIEIRAQAGTMTQTQVLHLNQAGLAVSHLQIPFSQSGEQEINFTLDSIRGEASDSNNSARLGIAISRQRMKVALLGSFPTRDFQFLRRTLQQSSWIDSTIVLPGEKISAEQLMQQQVIVLDDLAILQLDTAEWSAVCNVSSRQGIGLVLIAGPNHLPSEYANESRCASLLPFDATSGPAVWRTWAGAEAFFRFEPMISESLGFEDAQDSRIDWERLPAMYHYLQMPALRESAKPLLVEKESGAPVMTQMPFGAGKIIFMGFNETWRWRSFGAAMQENFWTNLLRHAAPLSEERQQQSQPAELADLSPDPSLLNRLAASSTGKFFHLADSEKIWQELLNYEQSHPSVIEYPLWHSPWLFALVLGCFGAEWALRKRFGLA